MSATTSTIRFVSDAHTQPIARSSVRFHIGSWVSDESAADDRSLWNMLIRKTRTNTFEFIELLHRSVIVQISAWCV